MTNYSKFEVWKEYEVIAMHFNGLLMQLRLRALAAVGLIVTIAGVIAKSDTGEVNWTIIAITSFVVLGAWTATFILDTFYYNKLLIGAVEAIAEIEALDDDPKVPINISTFIQRKAPLEVGRDSIPAVNMYYLFVGLVLTALLLFSTAKSMSCI